MAEATVGRRVLFTSNIDHKNTSIRAWMLLQQNQYPWNLSAISRVRVADRHTWIKWKWVFNYRCVGWILILFGFALSSVPRTFGQVSVDDLIARTLVRSFSVSPNGRLVAFLTIRADARRNIYHAKLCLQRTTPATNLVSLAEYSLAPKEIYDMSGQFLFSARAIGKTIGGDGMGC